MDVNELMRRAGENITGSKAFGPAVEAEGCTVVPVAWVAGGGGGGGGSAGESSGEEGEGVGFGFVAWPLGAYVVSGGDAKWVPAYDLTRVVIGAIGVFGALVSVRHRRRR